MAARSNEGVRIVPMNPEYAAAVVTWPAFSGDPVNGCVALVDQAGELIGYHCFGPAARVPGYDYDDSALDIRGGLHPDVTDGVGALATGLAYGWERWRPDAFRVTVASADARGRRVVESLGFRAVARFRTTREYDVLRLAGEVQFDPVMVEKLVAAQFPHWARLPVRPVGKSGVDNATYRLGDELSVRLPRYPRWIGQVQREQRWLPYLRPRLPVPVPVPVAQGRPGQGYPFPWSVYRWIEGENATLDGITDPRGTAVELAEFFAALQAVDATAGPPPQWSNGFRGVPVTSTTDAAVTEGNVRPRIAALEGLVDTEALTAVYEAGRSAPRWDRPPVWIHGDPAPTNMLIRDGRLAAVIDFGTLAVGDPATDLIVAWAFLDAQTRPIFRAVLGVDDATWARGRAWGLSATLPGRDELDAAGRRRLADIIADHRGSS
jgi:aminoglycoside phosphotransferase (APT) family kinase protein